MDTMVSVGSRVLIVVQNLPVPFDRRVWLEATTLQGAGYSVTVICPKMKGFNKSFEHIEGVEVRRYMMPFDPRTRIGFVGETLWALLRTFIISLRVQVSGRGFDVIHACNPPETYWMVGLFWKLFGKRFIFDHHDLSPELYTVKFGQSRFIRTILLLLEKATFKVADVCIATNESHKTIAIERGDMPPDSVFVVRSAPELSRFTLYESDPKWKNGKEHLIAFLGEMGEQDGVDGLLEALRLLRHEIGRADFHCVLIGGGTHQPELKALSKDLGIEGVCTFTGVVTDDELCRILSSADVGVDPVPKNEWSDRSTMNKIMEYMFFGLPIVAFDLAEARVSAGEAALFAKPGPPSELAACLNSLLRDGVRRDEMGEAASERLRKTLSWEQSVPALMDAYSEVRSI